MGREVPRNATGGAGVSVPGSSIEDQCLGQLDEKAECGRVRPDGAAQNARETPDPHHGGSRFGMMHGGQCPGQHKVA